MLKRFIELKQKYPTVILLGVISFFTDIASEMLYPITPIFLSTYLGSSMTSIGLIEGVAEGISSLLKTYSGFWSDKISKRKPFIFIGYLLSAISKPLIGLSTLSVHVFAARVLDRTGKGIRSAPRDALIADIVPIKDKGLAFGWHRLMDTFGAVVGPLLALVLLTFTSDLRKAYFYSLIPGILSVSAIFFLREPVSQKSKEEHKFTFTWNKLGGNFKFFLISWGLFCLTNSSDAFLLLKMKDSGAGLAQIILIYTFYNLVYALLSPYLGGLSDRIPREKVLAGGLAIFSLIYIGFAFSTHIVQFVLLFAFYGIYMAATDGVSKSLATDLVPSNMKGYALGVFGTVTGFGQIIASLATGRIWDTFNSTAALLFNTLGSLSCLILLMLFAKNKQVQS